MSELLHEMDVNSDLGTTESHKHLSPPTAVACVPHSAITHPSKPDWHQLSGISHPNNESILGRNDYLGCLHLALAYLDVILYGGGDGDTHWQQDKYQLWSKLLHEIRDMEDISLLMRWSRFRFEGLGISETPSYTFRTHGSGQRAWYTKIILVYQKGSHSHYCWLGDVLA